MHSRANNLQCLQQLLYYKSSNLKPARKMWQRIVLTN